MIADYATLVIRYNAQQAGAIESSFVILKDAIVGWRQVHECYTSYDTFRFYQQNGLRTNQVAAEVQKRVINCPISTGPTNHDGSLDYGIISHEYGHGISNSELLEAVVCGGEESMGEGWSDFFALVTTVNPGDTGPKVRGMGTYSINETTSGKGIRTYPYSTDMSINPHTYDDIIIEGLPHGVGSVWCAMLWDMYWAFSDTYGWDPDVIHGNGGNNKAIQLVMDGLKLQPCDAGFIEGRDAILQADMIDFGGANQCLIWNVFARRGLGANADGGDPAQDHGKAGSNYPPHAGINKFP